MQEVSFQQTQNAMNSGAPVINVLPTDKASQHNIQGSQNIPSDSNSFAQNVEKQLGSKTAPVTLYCASAECPASHEAATKLEQAGFTNVSVYKGGAKEWNEKFNSSQAA